MLSITYKYMLKSLVPAFWIMLVFMTHSVYGQDQKEQLQADKLKIENEIVYTNKLLNETKKTKQTSLNQLVILNKKISSRESLIGNINKEINYLDRKILENNNRVKELRQDLVDLKEEYARIIYYAYKNRNAYDRLMFVFSSEDFNQAYRRLKYFQQYNAYRKTQAQLIAQTQKELKTKTGELETQKKDKTLLVQNKEKEVNLLKLEKEEKTNTIDQLSRKEKDLRITLRKKEKEAGRLQNAIEEIIAAEMKAAAERAKRETKNKDAVMTEAEVKLSSDFSTNKGYLPWPAEKGLISSTFGEHQHPILKKVKTKNNGIDILTNQGGIARAIFEGLVISVRAISNTNKAVIVKHGEYFTVYSNLIDTYVKRGDRINIRQSIGLIYTNPGDNKTELHFEIWKGKTLLNPAYWLIAR